MKTLPHINCLLKVCYRCSVSLVALLTSDSDDLKAIERLSPLVAPYASHQQAQKSRTALLTALKEEPAPSVREVARRLGLNTPAALYTHHAELSKALTAKYRCARSNRAPRRRASIRRHPVEIHIALQDALNERPFPTLREVARRLGYVCDTALRCRFPDLCRMLASRSERAKAALENALLQPTALTLLDIAKDLGYAHETPLLVRYPELCEKIVARRKNYRAQQLDQIGKTLQSMLLVSPAPTLNEVAQRLGYKKFQNSKPVLLKYFPELCAAIKRRRQEHRKLTWQGLTNLMEQAVHEDPPPSLKEVISRTGHAPSHISVAFPIQREAIKARYRDFQRKLATERKAEAKSKIKQLALELTAAGVYPAQIQIAQTYKGKIGMPGVELAAVLREFRQENGIKYSRSD